MKKIWNSILLMCWIAFSQAVVLADAIAPEFHGSYRPYRNSYDVHPMVYVIIAIIVVGISCVICINVNKKNGNVQKDENIERMNEGNEKSIN